MQSPTDSPYEWPETTGCLTADLLASYHAWLAPALRKEWTPSGNKDTSLSAQNGKDTKPFEPRKRSGWLNVQRDLRPYVAWVIEQLKPYSHRAPYLPRKRNGEAMVPDLIDFHGWVLKTLERKKQSQTRSKKNPHS